MDRSPRSGTQEAAEVAAKIKVDLTEAQLVQLVIAAKGRLEDGTDGPDTATLMRAQETLEEARAVYHMDRANRRRRPKGES
jgi:hypothetical protein